MYIFFILEVHNC